MVYQLVIKNLMMVTLNLIVIIIGIEIFYLKNIISFLLYILITMCNNRRTLYKLRVRNRSDHFTIIIHCMMKFHIITDSFKFINSLLFMIPLSRDYNKFLEPMREF